MLKMSITPSKKTKKKNILCFNAGYDGFTDMHSEYKSLL